MPYFRDDLRKNGDMACYLVAPASGHDREKRPGRLVNTFQELFPRKGRFYRVGERVPDIGRNDAFPEIKLPFERKDADHFIDIFLYFLQTIFFPGPDLGRYKVNDRYAKRPRKTGDPHVKAREIHQHHQVRPVCADIGFNIVERPSYLKHMRQDLAQARDRDIPIVPDNFNPEGGKPVRPHCGH